MAFPPMQPAADADQARQHTYYDGASHTVRVSEREIPYPEGRLIISRTDLNGVIAHTNDALHRTLGLHP